MSKWEDEGEEGREGGGGATCRHPEQSTELRLDYYYVPLIFISPFTKRFRN